MKEVLEVIVKSIVQNKEAVQINEIDNGQSSIYQVKVDPAETGKVIGKQGRVAKSIRTLMKAAGTKKGKKFTIEILD